MSADVGSQAEMGERVLDIQNARHRVRRHTGSRHPFESADLADSVSSRAWINSYGADNELVSERPHEMLQVGRLCAPVWSLDAHDWLLTLGRSPRPLAVLRIRQNHFVGSEWNPTPPIRYQNGDERLHWLAWLGGEMAIVDESTEPFSVQCFPWRSVANYWGRFPHLVEVGAGEAESVPASNLEELIRAELADPQWKFRTVASMARATDLSEEQVRIALKGLGSEVRQPLVPDPDGREIFTLATRKPDLRERLMHLRRLLAAW